MFADVIVFSKRHLAAPLLQQMHLRGALSLEWDVSFLAESLFLRGALLVLVAFDPLEMVESRNEISSSP